MAMSSRVTPVPLSALATEDVKYMAKVVYAGDENEANNSTPEITVKLVASAFPAATDLTAANGADGVVLNWNEPQAATREAGSGESVTHDFEDGESFSAEYGDWIFTDVDESAVGGFQGLDIPGITIGQTKGSFRIWDQSMVGNQTFAAHSGTKYLFSLFRYDDGTVDDWAISPSLSGAAQTVSFYAKSYSSQYPEKIEVYYSFGDTDISMFTKVMDATTVSGDWTKYSVELPAGARRFAIRSCAKGSFMLMVDDVTFIPGEDVFAGDIQDYDIYRDGAKINDKLVTETTYTDATVVEGQTYNYVVVVVYDNGVGAPSNVATIQASGLDSLTAARSIIGGEGQIRISGFEGVEVSVSSIDGKHVAGGVAGAIDVVKVPAGIYIVKVGKKVAKVVVR